MEKLNKGANESAHKQRLLSLDALRGLDMFFLVGFAGIFRALPAISDTPICNWLASQSRHLEWNGFTAYDLVFPLFIFIVGVAIPFSFTKRMKQPGGKSKLLKHVLTRSITLSILGAVLWGTPWGIHSDLGFYSVLYRIGFSYFFASLIFMNTQIRGQIAWAFGLLLGYWLLMRFFPVPNYGMGNFNPEMNFSHYLRDLVADNISYDLRYVVNINLVTSISTALLGVLSGQLLMSEKSGNTKTKWLLLGGAVLILVASVGQFYFPINKKLNSPTYILLSCGLSAILLAIFYWLIDVRGYRKWAFFFVVVGVNPITIYVLDFILNYRKIANVFVGGLDLGNAQPLAFAIVLATIKWLLLYYLYRQKIFIKI